MLLKVVILTGESCEVVLPKPNCPKLFVPHAQTLPSRVNANEKFVPAATAKALVKLPHRTGLLVEIVFPVPSCPP